MSAEDPVSIPPEVAERLLEGQPPIRLELTLQEVDLLFVTLCATGTMTGALLAQKIRVQCLPQAQQICMRAALLHSAPDTGTTPN